MMKYGKCAALTAALCLAGCATVTRGTKQKLVVTSEPSGANVALSTGETCITPCELKLKRKSEFTTRVSKDGYEPAEIAVKGKLKGGGAAGAAGNVVLGGIIGGIVDGSNGSLLSLRPNPVAVVLKPIAAAAPAPVTTAADVALPEVSTATPTATPTVSATSSPTSGAPTSGATALEMPKP